MAISISGIQADTAQQGGVNWLDLVGNFLDSRKDKKAAAISRADAEQFRGDVAFDPFDVTGPTGGVSFTDGRAVTELDPTLQTQLDALLEQSTQFGQASVSFDPFEAQKDIFEQQKSLFAPAQEQDRLALENRLLQQGLLGSTTGALQTGALREAQERANVARQAQALQQAQSIQQQMQQRQLGALGGVLNVAQLPAGLLTQGAGLGGQQSAAAVLGGEAVLAAGGDEGGFRFGDLFGGSGEGGFDLGNLLGGLFGGGGGGRRQTAPRQITDSFLAPPTLDLPDSPLPRISISAPPSGPVRKVDPFAAPPMLSFNR